MEARPTTKPAAPKLGNGTFGPGTRVVLIGDSHTESFGFGQRLRRDIEASGSSLTVDAKSGQSPPYFANDARGGAQLTKDLRAAKPTTVVVALGTNFMDDVADPKRGQAYANANVKLMLDKIRATAPDAKIVWVGRPRGPRDGKDGAKLDDFDQKMTKAVAKYVADAARKDPAAKPLDAAYVSSRDATSFDDPREPPPKKLYSGEHIVDPAAARRWADAIYAAIGGAAPK